MKKRSLMFGIFLAVVLASLSLVSATIYYSNLETVYNLGDMIDLQISIDPILEDYLLEVDLICDNEEVIVFYVLPENGIANIKLPLNFYTIKDFNGDCYFLSEYGTENKESRMFEISRRLIVYLDTDSFFANPGDEITISGSATKLNGESVNGDIEITIPLLRLVNELIEDSVNENQLNETVENESEVNETIENATETIEEEIAEEFDEDIAFIDNGQFYGKVVDGVFSVTFKLDQDTPAGEYRLDILIYEEIEGKRTSEELTIGNLKVFQVLTEVDIALITQNVDPGEKLVFRPLLRDQAGNVIYDEASVIIQNKNKNRFFERVVQSESSVEYEVPTDLKAGYYDLIVSSGEISKSKSIYINEKAKADFKLVNGTLIITNIGNIPYKRDIEIKLNEKTFVKSVNLKLGESQEFKLSGEGEFGIEISDGEREVVHEGVILSGKTVSVKSSGGYLFFKTPIIWILVIIILGGSLLFLFKNAFKKKSFAYPFRNKLKRHSKDKVLPVGSKSKKASSVPEDSDVSKKSKASGALVAPSQAEQVLVLEGDKTSAAVIALKIKNKISDISKKSLEKSIEHVYEKRGAVYERGDFIFIIFSPLMTKSNKNEIEAAKAAEKIALILKEHNKKFRDKIEFGIGINSGQIVNKVESKKLKFTALGDIISGAKRLAELSDEQVLVSKSSFERGISEIKAEKLKIGDGEAYEVRRVIDYEKNRKFIQNFLERMAKEEKDK